MVRPQQGASRPQVDCDGESSGNDSDEENEPDPVDIVHVEDDEDEVLEARLARIEFERQMT